MKKLLEQHKIHQSKLGEVPFCNQNKIQELSLLFAGYTELQLT